MSLRLMKVILVILILSQSIICEAQIDKEYDPIKKFWLLESHEPFPEVSDESRVLYNISDPSRWVLLTPWLTKTDGEKQPPFYSLETMVYGSHPIACSSLDSFKLYFNGDQNSSYSLVFSNKNNPQIKIMSDVETGGKDILLRHRYYVVLYDNNSKPIVDIAAANSIDIEVFTTNCSSKKFRLSQNTLNEWRELAKRANASE